MTGSVPEEPCNEDIGECNCLPGYSGDTCSECSSGYWSSGGECIGKMIFLDNVHTSYNHPLQLFISDCGCQLPGTLGNPSCDTSGQCFCISGYTGLTCSDCDAGYYDTPYGCEGI